MGIRLPAALCGGQVGDPDCKCAHASLRSARQDLSGPALPVSRNLAGHRLQPRVPGIRQPVGSGAGSLDTRLRLADLPWRRCQARCNTMHVPQPHADTSMCLGPLRTTSLRYCREASRSG
ncbi:unnamed protein product [Symbiodinium sp. CCMP2456]|nr:unnamed protein product [Symbiodinium sp. CCMP2456]